MKYSTVFLFTWWWSCDTPQKGYLKFQEPATTAMLGMWKFNNTVLFLVLCIVIFVCWALLIFLKNKNLLKDSESQRIVNASIIEKIWTSLPISILFCLAIPSFTYLYSLDEISNAKVTLKILGSQWYWNYELQPQDEILDFDGTCEEGIELYEEFTTLDQFIDWLKTCLSGDEHRTRTLKYTAYMLTEETIKKEKCFGALRLLETSRRIIVPTNVHIRLLVSSTDVLHSWTIPTFGVKVDACPGRLNQTSMFVQRYGVFFGQCSEICGVNHGFMPIVMVGIPSYKFRLMVEGFLLSNSTESRTEASTAAKVLPEPRNEKGEAEVSKLYEEAFRCFKK